MIEASSSKDLPNWRYANRTAAPMQTLFWFGKPWLWGLGLFLIASACFAFNPMATEDASKNKTEPQQTELRNKELDLLQAELEQLRNDFQLLNLKKNKLSEEIQGAPELTKALRQEVLRTETLTPTLKPPTTQEGLERAIDLQEAQTKALEQSLTSVMEKIGIQRQLPGTARKEVLAAQAALERAQQKANNGVTVDENASLKSLQQSIFEQQTQNAKLQKELAQTRLDGYQRLLDLYTLNRDLLLLKLETTKESLAELRHARDKMRIQNADKQQALEAQVNKNYEREPQLLLKQFEENRKFSNQLLQVTEKLNKVTENLADQKYQLHDLRYRFEVAKQQLELTAFSQYVDEYLFRQRQNLQVRIKTLQNDSELTQQISAARFQQFRLDEELQKVRTDTVRSQLIKDWLDKATDLSKSDRTLLKQDLQELLVRRQQLLNKLVEVNADYVVNLTNIQLSYQEQLTISLQFYEHLNKELFWRRSANPLDVDWLLALPSSVHLFITTNPWSDIGKTWYQFLIQPILPIVLVVVAIWLVIWSRPRMQIRLKKVSEKVGKVSHDKFRYTFEALLISLFFAAPLPLLFFLLGYPLQLSAAANASVFTEATGRAFMLLAQWLFVFEFLRQLTRPNGLARCHFLWRPEILHSISRALPFLYLQMPFALVSILIWRMGDEVQIGVFGRLVFVVMLGFLIVAIERLVIAESGTADDGSQPWFRRGEKALAWVLGAFPVALIILSIRGYGFSATEVTILMYRTIMAGFLILVLHHVIGRGFAVMERRLAYSRAVAKRDALRKVKQQQEVAKSAGEAVPEVEMPKMDVATISEQNRALLRVFSLTLFVLAFIQIWQDLFQVVESLQEFSLWSYTASTDLGEITHQFTLDTLLYSLLAIGITYISVKNVPGLIEVMILRRFHLDAGVRFAVTTVARYLLVVVGLSVVSSMVGLDWTKFGWLVAALGVGLGFGLQEIFANFVSGLIILFERPIRIGDTVTINDLSGTVSKIHMRATTITDWDQKELIIPNKTFVTNQFINWTLSDSTTRLVVKVGVAYGSDTDLVTKTLLEIANAHKIVLRDPAPSAFFLGFGASSLDFELRVFVAIFGSRLVLLHDLNTAIAKRFAELGIEIAFPQLDLHVKELPRGFREEN